MFDLFSSMYTDFIINTKILFGLIYIACKTLDYLKMVFFVLIIYYFSKLLFNFMMIRIYKNRYEKHDLRNDSRLGKIFRSALNKAQIKNIPDLYDFKNARPHIFTIGTMKPAIFMTKDLLNWLEDDELEAALLHELNHVKRYDNLKIWFMEVFLVVIPVLIIQLFATNFVLNYQNSVIAMAGTFGAILLFKFVVINRVIFQRELSCDDLVVDQIKDPLVLASSITTVWKYSKSRLNFNNPKLNYSFISTFLSTNPMIRIDRLINYKKPVIKYAFYRIVGYSFAVIFIVFSSFIWRYHTDSNYFVQSDNFLASCPVIETNN